MKEYRKYKCLHCNFIYEEKEGWSEDGLNPGTCWDEVPEDWVCPVCGAGKEDFIVEL